MAKNHYVPQLILKKFSNSNNGRICIYNIKTGELLENVNCKNHFFEKDIYTDEVEQKFNEKIESTFGDFLSNFVLKQQEKVILNRKQLRLIKKFLLLSIFRSKSSIEFLRKERESYYIFKQFTRFSTFEEKIKESENDEEYWMRTLNVILDSDGSPESILKHPLKTFVAYRWSLIINAGYLAFWDSKTDKDDFVITDIGMTSENEKGWNGINVHNFKKTQSIANCIEKSTDKEEQILLMNSLEMCSYFHENFQMFPISSNRMIVLISPYFKLYYTNQNKNLPALSDLSYLDNDKLFLPNDVNYKKEQTGLTHTYDEEDEYIYEIKELTSQEVQYCNALFMDRIDTHLGFSSLNNAVKSILKYKKLNSYPYIPRVDYDKLYQIINDRYNK